MTRGKTALLAATGALLAFAIGFGWQFARAERLERELEEARRDLVFEQLESTLGAAAVEAMRGSHETARQLTSEFFTGLQQNVSRVPPDVREEMQAILAQRDSLITALSRSDPQAGDLLARLFVRYRLAWEGLRHEDEHAADHPGPAEQQG